MQRCNASTSVLSVRHFFKKICIAHFRSYFPVQLHVFYNITFHMQHLFLPLQSGVSRHPELFRANVSRVFSFFVLFWEAFIFAVCVFFAFLLQE